MSKNTKNNRPKRSSARAAPAPKKATKPPPATKIPRSMVNRVCGLTDPFCEHARGAKYPDDSNINTLPWTYHSRGTMSTSPAGESYRLFAPNFGTQYGTGASVVSGSNVTTWQTPTANTTFAATASEYRLVSFGVRFKNISAPLSSSGMVHIRFWPATSGAELEPLNLLSYACSGSSDTPLQDTHDVICVGQHTAQMPQAFYEVIAPTTIAAWQANGFGAFSIYVAGGPASTAVLDYEVFAHYEMIFDPGSELQILATPAPPGNTLLSSAAAGVTSTVSNIFTKGVGIASKAITDAALRALTRALPGPLGMAATAGRAIMVD